MNWKINIKLHQVVGVVVLGLVGVWLLANTHHTIIGGLCLLGAFLASCD